MSARKSNSKIERQLDSGAAALWAAALVLMGLIITQAGRPLAPTAAADVSDLGDYTVMTTRANQGADIMCLLDRRGGTLSVYGVENLRDVVLYQVEELGILFERAAR